MMDEVWFLLLTLPLLMLVGAILGSIAFAKVRRLTERVDQLEQQLGQVQTSSTSSQAAPRPDDAAAVSAAPTPPITSTHAREATSTDQHWGDYTSASPDTGRANENTVTAPTRPGLLERLSAGIRNNWMIWLGGTCVGLAGIFMVRYSIEQGLLGPQARVLLSLLTGIALHLAAEWLRRQRGQDNVFAALAGGASIILYAALFAAFKLLPQVAPGLVFALMALVSFITLALALRHGPVLAALGMLGGYLVPILVSTGSGEIELALIYSALLTLFSLWLLAYVQRTWLWLGVIGGSLLWWGLTFATTPAEGVRSLYLLALSYLFLAVPRFDWLLHRDSYTGAGWWPHLLQCRQQPDWPALPALVLLVLAQGISLATESVGQSSYFTLLLLPTLLLLAASRRPELNPLPALVLLSTAIAVVIPMLSYIGDQLLFTAPDAATQAALVSRFVMLTLLFTLSAVWLLRRGIPHAAFWSALGSFTPLLMLALGYYLFTAFQADWAWGGAALLLGLGYLALSRLSLVQHASELVTVILISSAHLGLSLAAVIWFSDATLTLALALQLISLAMLQQRYQLQLLPWVIRILLTIIVCRLTFNPWLLTYSTDSHWSLWTYGGATLCAFAAAWILRRDYKMQAWLLGGGAHLLVLTLAAEVRWWLYDGDIFRTEYGFTEASLNTVIWGCAGLVYLWRAQLSNHLKRLYRVLSGLHLAAAAANHLLWVVLFYNPLWGSTEIAATPVWNMLLISYGAPILLLLLAWQRLPSPIGHRVGQAAALSLLLFVSMEIRHLWQGQLDLSLTTPDGELYTYSAVWLLLASAALLAGAWWRKSSLYRGGMGLLLLVVAKLFLVDMSDLTGLWRVASFMGLGLALLALAWLHKRLMQQASTTESADQD